MLALINDGLDLMRWRVRAAEHYQYPAWQIGLVLLLLGIIAAAGATPIGGSIEGKMLFFTLFGAAETLLMAQFMRWWLRLAKSPVEHSLLGLLVAAGLVQVITPLTSWLPADVANIATVAIAFYGVSVMWHALTTISGVSRMRVLAGILLFSPLAAVLMVFAFSTGGNLGLIEMPSEMPAVSNPQDQAAPSSTGENGY
ncbi:hypothetical protein [Craterilacuibacter sp.]|uniref:hypothetical protein n=1 Tax=Craterilacuibacter sp. TaxID=2870909 RepID=UPI003F3A15E5